jgi:hypothetical protein
MAAPCPIATPSKVPGTTHHSKPRPHLRRNARAGSTQGHAHAELTATTGHLECEHAVQPGGGQDQGQHAERAGRATQDQLRQDRQVRCLFERTQARGRQAGELALRFALQGLAQFGSRQARAQEQGELAAIPLRRGQECETAAFLVQARIAPIRHHADDAHGLWLVFADLEGLAQHVVGAEQALRETAVHHRHLLGTGVVGTLDTATTHRDADGVEEAFAYGVDQQVVALVLLARQVGISERHAAHGERHERGKARRLDSGHCAQAICQTFHAPRSIAGGDPERFEIEIGHAHVREAKTGVHGGRLLHGAQHQHREQQQAHRQRGLHCNQHAPTALARGPALAALAQAGHRSSHCGGKLQRRPQAEQHGHAQRGGHECRHHIAIDRQRKIQRYRQRQRQGIEQVPPHPCQQQRESSCGQTHQHRLDQQLARQARAPRTERRTNRELGTPDLAARQHHAAQIEAGQQDHGRTQPEQRTRQTGDHTPGEVRYRTQWRHVQGDVGIAVRERSSQPRRDAIELDLRGFEAHARRESRAQRQPARAARLADVVRVHVHGGRHRQGHVEVRDVTGQMPLELWHR